MRPRDLSELETPGAQDPGLERPEQSQGATKGLRVSKSLRSSWSNFLTYLEHGIQAPKIAMGLADVIFYAALSLCCTSTSLCSNLYDFLSLCTMYLLTSITCTVLKGPLIIIFLSYVSNVHHRNKGTSIQDTILFLNIQKWAWSWKY